MIIDLTNLANQELIGLYPKVIKELKRREIVRTKNLVGELGEFYAVEFYKNALGLPKIQYAPPGTKNVDALSVNGERYAKKHLLQK